MNVGVLIRRNALDPVRSRSLWVLLGLFVLVFGLVGYLLDPNQGTGISVIIATIMAVLAPLAALAFSYQSIAGPRESGSLRVLLSYPYSRRELVLGTLAGRIIVVGLAVVVGVLTGGLTTLVFGGAVDFGTLAVVLALSLLLAIAIVGVAIGISASVATSSWAAVATFGIYLLFSAFWSSIPTVGRYVLNGFTFPTGSPPEWVFVWRQLNPINAFRTATEAITRTPLSDAFYHASWFGILVLIAWFVVPVVLGLLRFERADL